MSLEHLSMYWSGSLSTTEAITYIQGSLKLTRGNSESQDGILLTGGLRQPGPPKEEL